MFCEYIYCLNHPELLFLVIGQKLQLIPNKVGWKQEGNPKLRQSNLVMISFKIWLLIIITLQTPFVTIVPEFNSKRAEPPQQGSFTWREQHSECIFSETHRCSLFHAYGAVNFNVVALLLKNTCYLNNPVIKSTLPRIIFYLYFLISSTILGL